MKGKRYKWTCTRSPERCPAVLAPKAPRRDDVRRFCLDCSRITGRLVPRSAPTLEKKRAAKTERAVAKRQAKAEAKRNDPRTRARTLFARFKRLACWRDEVKRARVGDVHVVRRTGGRASGHAYYGGYVHLSILAGDDRWADNAELILHELAHVAAYRRATRLGYTPSAHGDIFRAALAEAALELCGDHFKPIVRDFGDVTNLDLAVRYAIRQAVAAGDLEL